MGPDRPHLPLVLCNVSVADLPLRDVIPAAAEAGFEAVSIYGAAVRRSMRRDGIGPEVLAALIREHGLSVTDVEAVADWFAPLPDGLPRWLDPGFDEAGFLDLAAAFGARTLVAVHFGPLPRIEDAADQFGRLCDAAAARGLSVAIEYPAMATLGDVGTAWAIVEAAARPNSGVVHDVWHHDRSPAGDAELALVPPERFLSIQLADAATDPIGPPMEDVRFRRLLSAGELRPADLLRSLVARGVRCPVGIEVFTPFDERPPRVRVRELYENLRATVEAAGLDPDRVE
jgi:sugar phosphate isomerase/epimerase